MVAKINPYELFDSQEITAVIEKGCEFEGKLSFEGVVRIGGRFKGQIFSNDVLVVSEGAFIEGDIEVDTVVISGEVSGNVIAKKRIEIHSPAQVRGSLTTSNLVIDEGGIFEGTSKMITSNVTALPVLEV